MFAALWCKSGYSFLEGASHPEELVEEAHRLGIRAIAIADRDGVYGMVRAHVKARELGIQLICGAQVTVAAPGSELAASPITVALHDHEFHGRGPGWGADTDDLEPAIPVTGRRGRTKRSKPRQVAIAAAPAKPSTLVLLAIHRAGWANLTRLLTIGRRRCDKGAAIVTWPEVCARASGLIALWGGDDALIGDEPELDPRLVSDLSAAFGDRLYAMLVRHRRASEVLREARLRERAKAWKLPLVAATEVL